ncbi:MAG: MFS transporter [Planctomycetota bacterium]|jgi:acyl-[acyl-carrier-protein]-phospholipid O-acyltransferase/long-chain-fatty-acid--[acyl-carrier-protein] ligase
MTDATAAVVVDGAAPSIYRDRSFWGLTISQFLGAFNDNLFKQLVLLLCLDYSRKAAISEGLDPALAGDRYSFLAMAAFAIPWLLFSGIAGVLADRTSKRNGIVLFKAAESVVMLFGLLAFLSGHLWPLLLVLFVMSGQSTFFGPPKYGSLPELFSSRQLPKINGVFQMTTFVAIIFGMATAGVAKQSLPGQQGLAMISGGSIVIGVIGLLFALLVRKLPVAQPDLALKWSQFGVDPDNWKLLRSNRFLTGVLIASALFWFTGGVVQPAVNNFGDIELGLGQGRASLMSACMGVGIAIGCLMSGRLSHERIRFSVVTAGAWGIVASLISLTVVARMFDQPAATGTAVAGSAGLLTLLLTAQPVEWIARGLLITLGFCAGLYVVPLQVALQAVPPKDQRGRMIGTMNLVNWSGILLSAVFYGVFEAVRALINERAPFNLQPSAVFATLAVPMLCIAVFYRPTDRNLSDVVDAAQ